MAWPLTGSPLAKYNRLLSDLRQYGTFYFIGSPDDITFLWEIIRSASDGVLSPALDDVANRPIFWMLTLATFLGDQIVAPSTPCPECPPVVPSPPCPPTAQVGLEWGPDNTVLQDFFANVGGFGSPVTTSLTFHSLESVTGTFDVSAPANLVSVFVPKLVSVGTELDIGGPTVQTIDFPELLTVSGSIFTAPSPATSISFPKLVSVGGDCDIVDNLDGLSEADFPELISVGVLYGTSCANLTRVGYPKLTTVGGTAVHNGNPLLTDVSFPVWLPTNTKNLRFEDNALTDVSVNHILARCVANAGYVSGTVDTSGGTSSAPTGQGVADKATLIGRGVTVTTN